MDKYDYIKMSKVYRVDFAMSKNKTTKLVVICTYSMYTLQSRFGGDLENKIWIVGLVVKGYFGQQLLNIMWSW